VIADGSPVPWEDGQSGRSGDMTWEYLNVPGYSTYMERLALACERVRTEYVCLVDDQECILWTGLQSAVRTLDAKPDHVCAGGLVSLALKLGGADVLVPWGDRGRPWDLTDPDPFKRFQKVTGPGQYSANLYYQVTRSKNLHHFAQVMRGFAAVSLFTNEVALAGYLSLAGKWAMGSYPYWIRAGSSVPPPDDTPMTISPSEIEKICLKIIEMREKDHANGQKLSDNLVPKSLHESIERGWGESSSWATSSLTYRASLRPLSEHTQVQKIVGRMKSFGSSALLKISPNIYRRMKPNSIYSIRPIFTFLDYSRNHAPNSYEVGNDLLNLSQIWQFFPTGILRSDL
jgi:hypothetical protein